ncbi:MAG: DNA polymerase I [Candidatus Paceibacterota bacterium]
MKKLVLIDGHALVHRAFHALPPSMSSPKGIPTNAVYGFVSVLIKIIKDLKPEYIVATFDLAGPTFRHEEFAEYKAHREKAPDDLHVQVPLVKEILVAFGIPIYEKAGFEADDLIGSIAELTKKHKSIQTIIATGDLDTLQLVDGDKVVVLTLKKGVTDTILYTQKEVEERYGLPPEQMIDFKGLKGDPSDNIPGVPGVGEKTASALIQKFKSIELLYEAITKKGKTKIQPPLSEKLIQKLLENKDMAFFSKKLATIIRDVPIEFDVKNADWKKNMNKEELGKILQGLGIYSLIKRINELDGSVVGVVTDAEPQKTLFDKDEIVVKSTEEKTEIKKIINDILEKGEFAFDVAMNPDSKIPSHLVFALEGKETQAIPWVLLESEKETFKAIKSIFEDEKIKKTGHDLKELSKFLLSKDIRISGLDFDTKLAAYLINPDLKDYALDHIYFTEFGQNIDPNPLKKSIYLNELKKAQWEKMKSLGLLDVFEKIEIPLAPVLAEMETKGLKVDLKAISDLSKKLNEQIGDLERKIYKLSKKEFNINSPQQLSAILFELPPKGLGIKGKVRKTSKGATSTAASELEKLVDEHPIIDLILKYRELQKLKTTYIEPFPSLVGKDGRLRTTLNQTGTATGRLASQNPNLQNIPARSELGQEFRRAFVAANGKVLLSLDYSQLELRIVAHLAQDKKMLDIFRRGEDIHNRTAAEIFRVNPADVTPNMRRDAKALNFGIIYGMGVKGFQRAVGKSREEAREFIDRYLEEFSGVAEYIKKAKLKARRDGYVATMMGRRRPLPEIKSGIPMLVAQAERIAINMPIQGAAADIIKIAMIETVDLLNNEYEGRADMLLQVHDELLFEVDEKYVRELAVKIKKIMESSLKLDAPLVVEAKMGNNWEEMDRI